MDENQLKESSMQTPIEKHDTAAWAGIKSTKPVSKVTVPSEIDVRNAKEWVDTNQK
ncbi:CDIF630_02480 family spore surface protein [Desnuesiella massiliensis]|uniref:CDIF630_02480 family spore surface protein n=1 Tax=Desnuesiella massiliensis TaxID=1650662 RepID=UPI000938E44D|nr:DUF3787 domain-containing protein [Desnuesiella massiliensis]